MGELKKYQFILAYSLITYHIQILTPKSAKNFKKSKKHRTQTYTYVYKENYTNIKFSILLGGVKANHTLIDRDKTH